MKFNYSTRVPGLYAQRHHVLVQQSWKKENV